METITEVDETIEKTSPQNSPRIVKNKQFIQKMLTNTRVKATINSDFSECIFKNIVFQNLNGCKFTACEFTGCAFQKDLIGTHFIKCKHIRSNFTEIKLQDCVISKTALLDITAMFTMFDTCHFMDGELSSRTVQNCTFLNARFERFNILTNTHIIKGTFTGVSFDTLTIRESAFSDTAFKNCSFTSVNQSLSQFLRCSFPYCVLSKCTYNDNKFLRCRYDHFTVKHSNLLRNNYEGSSMDHTTFERSTFSYNNLLKGSFYNINFTFCTTRGNHKKDAVFCNSEMLTSTNMEVIAYFKEDFNSRDAYSYRLKLLIPTEGIVPIQGQDITVKSGTNSLSFIVPYERLNACYLIQVEKIPLSTFASLFNYSTNDDEILQYVEIDGKMFLNGTKKVNGKMYQGFIPPKPIKKKRTKSL